MFSLSTLFLLITLFVIFVFSEPKICSPNKGGYFPPCPRNETLTPINITLYENIDGTVFLPDSIISLFGKFHEDPAGNLVCFDLSGSMDVNCMKEVASGLPADESNPPLCKIYKCSPYSVCTCKMGLFDTYSNLKIGDLELKGKFKKNVIAMIYNSIQPRMPSRKLLQYEKVFVDYNKPFVKISFTSPGLHNIQFRKEDYSTLLTTTNSSLTWEIPQALYTVSGYLFITIYNNNDIVHAESVYLIGVSFCRMNDCIICMDAIENMGCLSFYQKLMLFLVVGSFGILILSCFRNPILFVLKLGGYIFLFITVTILGCCFPSIQPTKIKKLKQKFVDCMPSAALAKLYEKEEESEADVEVQPLISTPQEEQTDEDEMSERPRQRNREEKKPTKERVPPGTKVSKTNVSNAKSTLYASAIFLGFLISSIGAKPVFYHVTDDNYLDLLKSKGITMIEDVWDTCADGATFAGQGTVCTHLNATHQSCKMEFDTQLTLPFAPASGCYNFADGNGHIVLKMLLFYSNQIAIYDLGEPYYTSNYTVSSSHHFVCDDPSGLIIPSCMTKCEICSRVNDPLCTRAAFGYLSGPSTSYTGDTTCDQIAPRFSDGCSGVFPNCMFSSYSIIPDQNYLEVRPLTTLHYRPELIGLIFTDNMVFINQTQFNGFVEYEMFTNVSAKIIGNYLGDIPLKENLKYVRDINGNEYMAYASDPNQPVAGILGEIQADTTTLLFAAGEHLRVASSLVTRHATFASVTYSYNQPAGAKFMTDPTAKRFPAFYEGNEYRTNSSHVLVFLEHASPLVMQLKSTSPLYLTREVSLVCPTAVLHSVSGFYQSSKGSAAVINTTSTCANGFVSVQIINANQDIDLWTHSVPCYAENRVTQVNFNPSKSAVSFTLRLLGNGAQVDIPIEYTAIHDTQITPTPGQNTSDPTNNTTNPTSGSSCDSWLGMFQCYINMLAKYVDSVIKGSAGWLTTIAVILVIGAAVVAAGFISFGSIVVLVELSGIAGPALALVDTVTKRIWSPKKSKEV